VGGTDLTYPTPPEPPSPPSSPPPPFPIADIRLSEIVISSLPAPYYRFAYDSSGRIREVSFASGLVTYEIEYDGNRMAGLQSDVLSRDRLAYVYDATGKVTMVAYIDGAGVVFVRVHLAYVGDRRVRLERERLHEGRFQSDKRMSFAYDVSGNLSELTDERLSFPGQTEAMVVDRFERYDTGINVDDFSLIHNEFFDHLVLLPGVQFQVGNPGGVTRSGSGLNYHIEYMYTYDDAQRPLTVRGEGTILNGAGAGSRFQRNATFSYQ
jgi:hypothetical protein